MFWNGSDVLLIFQDLPSSVLDIEMVLVLAFLLFQETLYGSNHCCRLWCEHNSMVLWYI